MIKLITLVLLLGATSATVPKFKNCGNCLVKSTTVLILDL